MSTGTFKIIKDTEVEREMHWKIPNFLSLPTDTFTVSPDFKFLNVSWLLKIDPCENDDTENHLAFILKVGEMKSSYDVLCTFGIKKVDDSMIGIYSLKYSFSTLSTTLLVHKFFTRSSLLLRKSKLLPFNYLTIICNLKLVVDPIKLTEVDTLSENMKSLFTNEEFCDITIQLENKEFKAHKIILAARSPVFAAMFKHETSEKKSGIINIPDCDPDSFQEFLEFLYCGKLQNVSFRSALHLYKTADKYNVPELKNFCVEYMKQNFKVENVCDVISLADLNEETELLAAAQVYFNRNLNEILVTAEWKAFLKNNLNLANKVLIQMASKAIIVE